MLAAWAPPPRWRLARIRPPPLPTPLAARPQINNNRLASFDNLATLATTCPALATVYLEGNPLADDPDYAARSLGVLPAGLSQLDALPVPLVRRRLSEGPAALAWAGIGRVAAADAPVGEGEGEGEGVGGGDADAMAPS